jgi:predicted nucleotidyltransferase
MKLGEKYLKIIESLNKQGVEYILIGGLAVIYHGMPRLTQDIDLFIEMNETNVDNLRKALNNIYNDSFIDEITYEELNKYSVIRYGTPDKFYIDIIYKLGENSYENLDFENKEINTINVKLASEETLIKLKSNTLRPKDEMDILYLKESIKKKRK